MRKLGLALTLLLASTAMAAADSVTITATDSLGPTATFGPDSSGFFSAGPFNIGGFNVNQVTASFRGSPNGCAAPCLLDTNTLNVDNTSTTLQTLTVDVTVTGNAPPSGLTAITSAFDSVGLTTGWSLTESTFVNGVLQRSAGFTGTGGTGPLGSTANFGPGPFTLDARFVISNGGVVGEANAGIEVNVPGPVVGAGLPGLLAAMGFGGWNWRRRRKTAAAA